MLYPSPVARLAALTLLALLCACAPIATDGVTRLDFEPVLEESANIQARHLLRRQKVPRDSFMTIREAIAKAPDGSPILTCHRAARLANFWGPCSHIARKLSGDRIAETIGPIPGQDRVGVYPARRLERYYAVMVLDVGQRPEDLAVLERETERLAGSPYDLSENPGTFYCSNFQNHLERALGRPDLIPRHPVIGLALPADVLLQPRVKVLYVGVNPRAE